jgi:hypothetical protein
VRQQQGADRFVQAGNVLGEVDQGDGEVARAVQDGEGERGDEDEVADAGVAVLPEGDAPSALGLA